MNSYIYEFRISIHELILSYTSIHILMNLCDHFIILYRNLRCNSLQKAELYHHFIILYRNLSYDFLNL